MLITDQVATAPCTDPIQVRIKTFCAKPMRTVRSSIVVLVSLTLAGVMYGQDTERKKPNKIRAPNYRIGGKYRTVVSKARPISVVKP